MCVTEELIERTRKRAGKGGRAAEEQRGLAKRYGHTIIGGVLIENPGKGGGGTGESAGPERELKENWAQGKKRRFGIFSSEKICPQDPPNEQLIASSPPPKRPAGAGGGPTPEKNTRQGLKHSITRGHKVEDCELTDTLSEESRERERQRESKTDRQIILLRVGRTSSYQKKKKRKTKPTKVSSTGSLGGDEDKQRDVCEVEMLS